MVLLHLAINISFRAMYGLALLEISDLDQFCFPPILYRRQLYTISENAIPCIIRRRSSTDTQSNDGAPAHFSRIARKFLNNNYTNRWIGRRRLIAWPARSPD